jgi:hypothetical protein
MKDPSEAQNRSIALVLASLFSSVGTLVCCALPALFVSLGAGAALAGLVSAAPWLVALSRYKLPVFGGAALLLIVAGVMMVRARSLPCPIDPVQAKLCGQLRIISW